MAGMELRSRWWFSIEDLIGNEDALGEILIEGYLQDLRDLELLALGPCRRSQEHAAFGVSTLTSMRVRRRRTRARP